MFSLMEPRAFYRDLFDFRRDFDENVQSPHRRYLHREFAYGNFKRVVTLPAGVDVEKLAAEFNHGVLEINAPLAAAALPRRIEIKPALKKAA